MAAVSQPEGPNGLKDPLYSKLALVAAFGGRRTELCRSRQLDFIKLVQKGRWNEASSVVTNEFPHPSRGSRPPALPASAILLTAEWACRQRGYSKRPALSRS